MAVDAACLALYLLAANPAVTGIPAHEWLGLGALATLMAHCIMHYDWFARSFGRLRSRSGLRHAGRLALDVLTGVVLVVCVVSGVLISGTVLPTFGLYAEGFHFWNPLHAFSAKLLLALIIVHVVLHVRQIAAALEKK